MANLTRIKQSILSIPLFYLLPSTSNHQAFLATTAFNHLKSPQKSHICQSDRHSHRSVSAQYCCLIKQLN